MILSRIIIQLLVIVIYLTIKERIGTPLKEKTDMKDMINMTNIIAGMISTTDMIKNITIIILKMVIKVITMKIYSTEKIIKVKKEWTKTIKLSNNNSTKININLSQCEILLARKI